MGKQLCTHTFFQISDSGGASMLMFERDKQARLLRQIQLDARHRTARSFHIPQFTKEFAFALLVAFQFFLSTAYLTPIYFMERKPKSIVFSFFTVHVCAT